MNRFFRKFLGAARTGGDGDDQKEINNQARSTKNVAGEKFLESLSDFSQFW